VETELELQLGQQKTQQASSISPIEFKTAFEELYNKHVLLRCGIEKIDSLLQLTLGDRLAVIGNQKYTQTLIARLCVNALLLASPFSKTRKSYNTIAGFFTHLM
jgi:hypothetical protein